VVGRRHGSVAGIVRASGIAITARTAPDHIPFCTGRGFNHIYSQGVPFRFVSLLQVPVAIGLVVLSACGRSASVPPVLPAPPAPPAATPAIVVAGPPAGRLSGTVTDAETGAPVAGVQIAIGTPLVPALQVTTTSSTGAFDVGSLPPGTYTITARLESYVRSGFAYRSLLGTQGGILLADQEHRPGIEIRLTKEASISGRILSPDGAAAPGVVVNVLRPHFLEGQRLLATFGSTRTDAQGRFRVAGLLHGDYYVTAFEADPAGPAPTLPTHSPTYYPGSADAAGAKRIRVRRATEVSGIEFVVRRVPWSRIVGIAKRSDSAPLRFAAIIMQPNDPERLSPGQRLGAKWEADGQFSFDQVPPGDYIIRALGGIDPDAAPLFAALPLTVEGRDTTGVTLTLTPGATLSGRIRFQSQGSPGPDVTQLRLYAPLTDGTKFGGEPKGRIESDGRFNLDGVDAGLRLIRALQVPAPWSLERVLQRGRDITDTPIEIRQGQKLQDVELIFTDAAPSVSGIVRTGTSRLLVDRLVVVFPVDQALWGPASRHIQSTRTDWLGRYQIGPLPPGEYFIVSVTDFEEEDIFERETLDQISRTAIRTRLSVGQKHVQDLRDDSGGSD
jgi:hypothetical protein